jgi:hypothetical protein
MTYLFPLPPSLPGLDTVWKVTPLGGLCKKLINRTGAASVKGQLVEPDSANDDSVTIAAAGEYDPIGVFLDSGVANGEAAWIVYSGVAEFLLEDNTGATAEDWLGVSDGEAGHTQAIAIPSANVGLHFREVGHALSTVAAPGVGNHALVRGFLHFN